MKQKKRFERSSPINVRPFEECLSFKPNWNEKRIEEFHSKNRENIRFKHTFQSQVQLTWVSSPKMQKFEMKFIAFKGFKNMTQFSISFLSHNRLHLLLLLHRNTPSKEAIPQVLYKLSSMCLTNVLQIELKKTCLKKDEQFWFRHNIANNRGSNTEICKSQWQGFIFQNLSCLLFVRLMFPKMVKFLNFKVKIAKTQKSQWWWYVKTAPRVACFLKLNCWNTALP